VSPSVLNFYGVEHVTTEISITRGQNEGHQSFQKRLIGELIKRAEEYLDALAIELSIPLTPDQSRAAQLALLQDFIEVHNAALEHAIELELPEDKEEIDMLLFNGNNHKTSTRKIF
jgi:hypothetical protein